MHFSQLVLYSVTVLITLVALLSIAASGCSSLGIALDTNSVEEKYSVTLHRDLSDTEENKTTNNIQVLPKIVRGKSYSTLLLSINSYHLGVFHS